MKRRSALCLLMSVVLLVGCAAPKLYNAATPAPAQETMASAMPGDTEQARDRESAWNEEAGKNDETVPVGETQSRMIIYDAELNLVVEDSQAAQEEVVKKAAELGGYISNSSSNRYSEGLLRITLTMRVPAENFDAAMTSLRAMALEVSSESIGSQDVTQEYVDLGSRLKALEAKEQRLEELMDAAEDTEAVLAVYEQLSATQIDIEQTKGRMQYLERMSAMATITIILTPDEMSRPIEVAGWRPTGTFKRAFEAMINAFHVLIDALIWIVVWGIPVGGSTLLVLWGFIKLLGLIFKRRGSKKTPPATDMPLSTK
ncbi:MAG: DUF4349 domain-containing protein [Anaerolineae bacterium]|nr:DUF4349 domain-containing protein [Anaerolineae bacterium]